MLHFLNEASICYLGGSIQWKTGLSAICSGIAGYTVYSVLREEQKVVICANISAYITPLTVNLCSRSIVVSATMVFTAMLEVGLTSFFIVTYGMKVSLSLLGLLKQVQAPVINSPNRCDFGVTYDGDREAFLSSVPRIWGWGPTKWCIWLGLATAPESEIGAQESLSEPWSTRL